MHEVEARRRTHYNQIKKLKPDTIFVKFLRFFCLKVPDRTAQFSIYHGKIKNFRINENRLFISVLNPFIHELDGGDSMKEIAKFRELIRKTKRLYRAITNGYPGEVESLIIEYGTA